jgi:DNA-binding NarL/FixJ family response regulator
MQASPFHVVEAIKAGASGYILKTSELVEVRAAIRSVLAGEKYITPALAHSTLELIANHTVLTREDTVSKLTARQRDVLKLLAEGKALKEIAGALHISVKTVEFHKHELCERVGLRTTAELTRLAVADGLISANPRGKEYGDNNQWTGTG